MDYTEEAKRRIYEATLQRVKNGQPALTKQEVEEIVEQEATEAFLAEHGQLAPDQTDLGDELSFLGTDSAESIDEEDEAYADASPELLATFNQKD